MKFIGSMFVIFGVMLCVFGCSEEHTSAADTMPEEVVRKHELFYEAWNIEIFAEEERVYQHTVSSYATEKDLRWFGLEPCEPHLGQYRNWCEQYIDDSKSWSSLDVLFILPVSAHYKAPGQRRVSYEEGAYFSSDFPWFERDLLRFVGKGSSLRMKVPLYEMVCDGSAWNEASVEIASLKTQFYPERASSIVIDGVFLCATTSVDVQVRLTRLEEDAR